MTADAETLTLLRDAAQGLVRLDGARVRGWRGRAPGFDRGLWTEMAGQGWLSIMIPESADGLGLGITAANAIAERIGYAAWPEPFVAAGVMAPVAIAASPDGPLKARLLADVMTGRTIATLAWQSETGSLDPAACAVGATIAGEEVCLDGAARLVPVPAADAFLVLAKMPGGLALVHVGRDAAGLGCRLETAADGSPIGWLQLERVKLAGTALLAPPGKGEAVLNDALDAGLAATSAELVGVMERALDLTLEFMRTRRQFGQAIGSFQALQHRAVDLYIQKQLSRAALNAAEKVLGSAAASAADRTAAASSAKARASEAALLICEQSIQLHGAIGFTDEYDVGLAMNRALVLSASLGNAGSHRRRYGRLSRGEAA